MNWKACVRTADSEHTTCVPWSKTCCLVPRSQLRRVEHAAHPPMLKAKGERHSTANIISCYCHTHIWMVWGLGGLRTVSRFIMLIHILYWASYEEHIAPRERKSARRAKSRRQHHASLQLEVLSCPRSVGKCHTFWEKTMRKTCMRGDGFLCQDWNTSTKYRLTPEIHAKHLKPGCAVGLHQASPMGSWWSKSGYLGGAWEALLLISTWGST